MSHRLRFQVLLGATIWSFALVSPTAQSQGSTGLQWVEDARILERPYQARVGPGFYVTTAITLRGGQEPLWFVVNNDCVLRIEARVVVPYVGGWDTLNTRCVNAARWRTAPDEPGRFVIETRVTAVNGSKQTLRHELAVVPPADRAFRLSNFAFPSHEAAMMLWEGTTPALDSPLLVVEGIDADNINSPSDYYGLAAGLFSVAQQRGADVMILNFHDGGADLRQNAVVVQSAVEWVNANRVGLRPLDVAGLSMGGVVARYALAAMEADGRAHDVARFVSIDAPQRGAVIDAGLQDWIAAVRSYSSSVPVPSALDSPAGKQLLGYNAFDEASPTEHERFFADLEALNGNGYPHETLENVGVSFGTGAPNPDTGTDWLTARIGGFNTGTFRIEPGEPEAAPGSFLPRDVTDIYGNIHLLSDGIEYEFERFTHPTFIPYASALDLVDGETVFTLPTIQPGQANFHDELDTDLIAPLLDRLAYPSAPAPVSIEGAAVVYAGEVGQWRAYLAFGAGAPTYRWEYRFLGSTCCGLDSRGRRGVIGPREVTYNRWHYGGSGPTFERRVNGDAQMEVRVHVTRDGLTRTTTRTVRYSTDSAYATSLARRSPSPPGPQAAAGPPASLHAASAGGIEPPRLSPNPTRHTVTLSGMHTGLAPVSIGVYDLLGRRVRAVRLTKAGPGPFQVTMDTSTLPAGLYLVRTECHAGEASAPTPLSVLR